MAADLTISKTETPATAVPGELLTYNITVANAAGTTAATNAVLSDALPPGETFVAATTTQGTVSASGNVVTADLGSLASATGTATVTIEAMVNSISPGTLSNTASVSSPDDPGSPKASVAATTTVGSLPATAADVSVSAAASPSIGTVGSPETYTLTIKNNDPTNSATGVTLTDVLPAGATYDTGVATGGGSVTQAGGVAAVNYATLAPGASQTVTLTVTPAAPGEAVNAATVTTTSGDPNLANNVAVTATPVQTSGTTGAVDLSIAKTGSPATGTVGANETYTVTVTNNGTSGATNVVVTDVLPAGATFVSGTSSVSGVTVDQTGGVATATLPTLAAGASATLTIVVTPTAPGVMVDTANVEGAQPDLNQVNNTVTLATPVQTSGTTGAVDLSITKSGLPTTGTVGLNETYTLIVTNNDASATATNVVVSDVLPAGTTYVSGTSSVSGVTVNNTGGVATATIPTLAPGASATISIVITPTAAGSITDTAVVEGAQPDTKQSNNMATLTTTVVAASADLSVTKTGPSNPVNTGQNETYTIVVKNNDATNSASNVVLTDALPSGATYVSATSSAGGAPTQSGGTVTANLGSLAAGASDTITVVVSYASAGTFTDTATVTSSTPDDNSANNSASVTTTVQTASNEADVSISKTGAPDPVQVGQSLSYTITVTNSGPVAATGTVVTDALPAGATFVSATDTTSGVVLTPVSGVLTDSIGNLAAGATETITVVVTPTAVGTMTNTASVNTTSPNASTNTTASFTSTVTGTTPGLGHICYVAGDPGDGTNATFVRNLYRELLGRDPDAPGMAFWTGKAQGNGKSNGAEDRNEIIGDFLTSQEYREHLVDCIYENFLHRAPDAPGLQYWAAKLGTPRAEAGAGGSGDELFVVAAIAGSPEYYLTHGNTDQGFVDGLYQDILGRAADGSGLAFWMHESSLHRDHDAVVRDLLNTAEAHHKLLNADFPASGNASDMTLPGPGQQAGGSYALAEITGGGWENLYFQGGFGNESAAGANDVFFAKLQGQTPWDDVIEDMLVTQQYFNASQKGR